LGYLLTLRQHNNEKLKKFMGRFNLEKMAFEDHTDGFYSSLLGSTAKGVVNEEVHSEATGHFARSDG
jgi:hypothetical protein